MSLRLIICRALCSAMDRVFRFTRSFLRQRSEHNLLRISIIASSCGSRYDFLFVAEPHFPVACAIAFVTTPNSGVCTCRIGSRLGTFTASVHQIRSACSHGSSQGRLDILLQKRLPPNHPSAELASTIDATRVPKSASSSAMEFPTSPVCSLTHHVWSWSFF